MTGDHSGEEKKLTVLNCEHMPTCTLFVMKEMNVQENVPYCARNATRFAGTVECAVIGALPKPTRNS